MRSITTREGKFDANDKLLSKMDLSQIEVISFMERANIAFISSTRIDFSVRIPIIRRFYDD
jgi:hypothetical protein